MELLTTTLWMPPSTQFLIHQMVLPPTPSEQSVVEDHVKGLMVAHVPDEDVEYYWSQYRPLRATTPHWSPSGHGAVDRNSLDATIHPVPRPPGPSINSMQLREEDVVEDPVEGTSGVWEVPPVHGLHLQPLLDAAAQRLLVVETAELGQDPILVGLVLIPAGVDLGDQGVKIGIWSEGSLGNQLLPARGTLLIPGDKEKGQGVTRGPPPPY